MVKQTLNKAKLNSEDHFLAMLSLNSQPDQNGTSAGEKLFGRKLSTILSSLISSNQSIATEKHTVTKNLRRKLPEITPGTTFEPTNKFTGTKKVSL